MGLYDKYDPFSGVEVDTDQLNRQLTAMETSIAARPEPIAKRSTLGEMGAGFKRGLFVAVPEMAGGAIKAYSDVDSDWYKRGQDLQDSAKAIAGLPDFQKSKTADDGHVNKVLVSGAEGVGQMAPIIAGGVVNPYLGAGMAATMYGGSTYQDTKERMLKQEGIDDAYAAANPNDPRVVKAKNTGLATGGIQGLGEGAMSLVGGKFVKAALPNIGKATVETVLGNSAKPGLAALKQYAKGLGLELAGETITEPLQDEGQAAVERAAGLKDAPKFMEQAAQSAQGGFGTALLLAPFGIPAHIAKYSNNAAVQKALVDPAVNPQARSAAAHLVAGDLAKVDPEAASNFMQHAAVAIGDEATTGSAPYALDLSDPSLLKPFATDANSPQNPALPDTSQASGLPTGAESTPAPGGAIDMGTIPEFGSPTVARDSAPVAGNQYQQFAEQPFSNAPAAPAIAGVGVEGMLNNLKPVDEATGTKNTLASALLSGGNPYQQFAEQPFAQAPTAPAIAGVGVEGMLNNVQPAASSPRFQALQWAGQQLKDPATSKFERQNITSMVKAADPEKKDLVKYWASFTGQRKQPAAIAGVQKPQGVAASDTQSGKTSQVTEATPVIAPQPLSSNTVVTQKPPRDRSVQPAQDDLITAIGKLGGLNRDQAIAQWGNAIKDSVSDLNKHATRNGKVGLLHVISSKGKSLDAMREALEEHGYLPQGSSIEDMYAKIDQHFTGKQSYSNQHQGQVEDQDLSQAPEGVEESDYPFSLEGINFPEKERKRLKFLKQMLKNARNEKTKAQARKALQRFAEKNKATVPDLNRENKQNIAVDDLKSLKKGDVVIHSRNGFRYQFVGVDQDANGNKGLIVKQFLKDDTLSKSQSYLPLAVGLQRENKAAANTKEVKNRQELPRSESVSARGLVDSDAFVSTYLNEVLPALRSAGITPFAIVEDVKSIIGNYRELRLVLKRGADIVGYVTRIFDKDGIKISLIEAADDENGGKRKMGAIPALYPAEARLAKRFGVDLRGLFVSTVTQEGFKREHNTAEFVGDTGKVAYNGNERFDEKAPFDEDIVELAKSGVNSAADKAYFRFYEAKVTIVNEEDNHVRGSQNPVQSMDEKTAGSTEGTAGTDQNVLAVGDAAPGSVQPGSADNNSLVRPDGQGGLTDKTRNSAKHHAFLQRMLQNAKTDKARNNARKAIERFEARTKPHPTTIDEEINSMSLDDMAALFSQTAAEAVAPAPVRNRAKMQEAMRKKLARQLAKTADVREQKRLQQSLEKLQALQAKLKADNQPAEQTGRPEKDNGAESYFKKGERVQFANGVHGEVISVDSYTMRSAMIGFDRDGMYTHNQKDERNHMYRVRKDNGVEVSGYFAEMFKETDPAPEVVPAPVWGKTAVDPDDLLIRIENSKKRSEKSREAAGRAKKAENIKKHNSDADVEFKAALDMQAAYDTWAEKYPEEAAKYAPVVKPAASPAPAAAGIGIEGLKVTFNAVQNGIELRFAGKPDDATLAKIKANGFRWAMGKKIWYAKDTPARRTFVDGLQGKQSAPPEVKAEKPMTNLDAMRAAGAAAFAAGKTRIPIDPFNPSIEMTPGMKEAWLKGWDNANLAAPVAEEKTIWNDDGTNGPVAITAPPSDYTQLENWWNKELTLEGRRQIATDMKGKTEQIAKTSWGHLNQSAQQYLKDRIYGTANDPAAPPSTRSAADILGAAAKSGVKGADEALKGLYELFGGKSLKSFPGAVDEDTYRAAKPHFTAALENFRAAGKSLKEFFSFLIDQFGAGIQPYVMKFMQEKQQESGILEVTNQEAANNDDTTDGGTGKGSLEGSVTGTVPDPARKRETGKGSGSVSGTDDEGNGNTDEGGYVRSGSLAGQPESVHLQPGEGAEGSAVLPSGATGSVSTPSEPRTPKLSGDNPGNYRITAADDLGGGTRGDKINNNLAAIRLVKQLDKEGRYPTRAEQSILAKYVGWGGLKSVFDPNSTKPQDQKARTELEQLLTEAEYFEARQSVLNAHYTSPEIIGSIYSILQHMGFKGGNVLEPTYGSGNFIGLMPEQMAAASKWYGSELDPITSKIGKFLYPDAQLLESGFQDAEFPYGKFDLAIGNPPFGSEQITDTNKKRAEIDRFKIHNYVIAKSGMHLRPGGVMAMVVTSRFMDTANPEARDYLAKQFKFLTAIRLPNDAFAKNAGTEVTTDLVFFQKLMPGENPDLNADWLNVNGHMVNAAGEDIYLNEWFASYPHLMLGEPSMKGTMYGGHWRKEDGKGEFTLNARTGQDTATELYNLMHRDKDNYSFELLRDVFKPTPAKADAAAVSIQMNREDIGIGGYIEENGQIFMREDDDQYGNPVFIKLTAETPWADSYTEKTLALQSAKEKDHDTFKAAVEDLGALGDGKKTKLQTALAAAVKSHKYSEAIELLEKSIKTATLGQTRLNRIKGMLAMRQAAYDLIEAERFDLSDMESKRKELNQLYDAFVSKHGYLSDSANASLMADDVKIESGLEVNYRKAITAAKAKTLGVKAQPAKADKAAIMKQRVFFPVKEITSAANSRDGYGISLSEKGRLDLAYIAGLTGQTTDEVIKELADEGLIFKDPATGTWKQEDEYLSGNVKAKLQKVLGREGFEKNVEALTEVLPKDVTPEEIFADLGATWIPAEVYKEFADLMGVTNANVLIIPETGTVKIISGGHVQNDMNVMLQNPDHDVASLINHIAAKQAVVAYDSIPDGNGGNKRVVNKDRTKALVPMVKRVSATFRDWLMADPRRATELTKIYNDTMNTHAPRTYNGKHLKTVGASPAVRLRNSQRNASWRMLQSPVVLLDHVVGAGKTFTIITGVMERKRLGLSNKSMIVVPNHLVGQWGADFLKLYPGARILATTEKDFKKNNRKRLFARIATGNYDAVIVGHSSFGFVPLEPETQQEFMMEEVRFLERALTTAKDNKDSKTVRNITERIKSKTERIKSLMNKERDDVVTFENMGVDNLVVDESHEFKNLEYSTSMQNITGMGNPNGAKKSFDLYAKIQYLRSNDGAVTFATGTPISNSLVEMYTILRYLNRQGLKDRNLDVFDAWAKAYASIESRIEYTPSQKLKDRQVMATFNNLPELLQLYSEFADVISMKDLKRIYAEQIKESNKATGANEREEFPVPKVKNGARYLDVADPTTAQRQYMDYLVARANRLEKLGGQNDPKTDNHLWLMNDARKMALDIRLVDPSAPSDPDNKVNRAANNIKRIYDQWHADKGTQLVFCDLSTPAGSSKSEAAKFIKSGMTVLGLEKDKALANTLNQLSYSEQWTYLKNRIELKIEELSESETVTDADEELREKLEKYLDEVDDNDIAALQTVDTGFSVYDDLKATLIDKGIPASEIRFIHEANTRDQKTELFNMVNSGLVRVLIGSSRKMGAGTNAQERLVGLHHMDAPWRPSDVEQREGRIIRQGNMLYERDPDNFEVEIPAYSTRNTFDSVSWQILARKAEMLEDFRSGARSMQDSESDAASYSEFMAESTGNPIFREKFRLEREIEELESTERNIMARRAAGERIVKNADADIAKAEKTLQAALRDMSEVKDAKVFEVDGKKYADDLTEAYNKAYAEYETANKEYTEKLLPEYVAAMQQLEEQELDDKAKKEAKKLIKKPVEPAKPTLPRLEKSSQAARAALRVSELLDDVAERGEVEFAFGGSQVVIEKVPVGAEYFNFKTFINGKERWGLSANGLKHMSQQKLMELFNTGEIASRVAADLRVARAAVDSVKQSIDDAERTLSKLKFEDADKLKAMQERYKAVVEEVNQLEKDLDAKREQEANQYISADGRRFGGDQFSLASPTTTGLNAAELQREFAGVPFKSKIKVVQTAEDLPGFGSKSLFSKMVEGQYKDGTIYLVAGNLPSVERARTVALGHELTHAGQSEKLTSMAVAWFKDAMSKGDNGSKFQQATLRILKTEAGKRGYRLTDAADFRKAVQEATAVIAETAYRTGEKAGFMTRLLMYLKHFMRNKLGWKILPFTDKELAATVSMMMRQGEKNLSNGNGPDGGQHSLASSVGSVISDLDLKAVVNGVKENWKQTVNPLDWSRTARWFDDWTPESIKAAFGYLLAVPHFQAERDASKRPFVDASENREIDRMDMMLQFLGFNPGQEDTRSLKEKTWDFFTKWQSGQHQTDWEKMNQRRTDLTADQQLALDAMFVEGDVSATTYSSLDKALLNPRIARTKPTAATFALYQDIRNHMDGHVSKIREQRMERMMREAGIGEEVIKNHIADYRNELRKVGGWMTRNHGNGEYRTAVYHLVKDLKFNLREVSGDRQQAFLPYFPGNAVLTALEQHAKEAEASLKVTPKGSVIITGKDLAGFLDQAAGIIPKIGPQRVMVFSRYHQTKGAARSHADLVKKDLKAAMPHNFRSGEQYEVGHQQIDVLNEAMFQNMKNDMAVEALLEQSAQRALKRGDMTKEQFTEFRKDLVQNTAEVLMGRAAGKYQIRRAEYLIEGYDTENAVSLYQDYMMGVAGMMSKADYAGKQFEHFRNAQIPVKQWAAPYIFDSLRNQGLGDRISGNLRAFASLWYMGLKPASALINATQNYTLGLAELGRHITKGSPLLMISRANADIIKGKLTKEEEQLFESAIYRQQEMGSALSEITGHNEDASGKAGKLLHNLTSKTLALFQNVEIMNRKTMILAGYRAFRSADTKPGMIDYAAFEKSMEINSSVNFNMHRGNLPGWARTPVGHTLYALQSFTFNSFNWMYNRLTSGEKRDVQALLRYSGAILAIGGMSALAGGDELDKLFRKLFGKSVKLEFQQYTRKHLKQFGSFGELVDNFAWHGLPGAAGVNISNSLRLQIPIVSQILSGESAPEAMGGVFSGLLQKAGTAARAAGKGDYYRAAEAAAPEAISGAMRAYRQATKGVTTMGGKQVFDENGQPVKYSTTDAALRIAGLQPLEQSRRTEVTQVAKEVAAEWRDNRQNVIDAIRIADTQQERQKTLKLVQEFNVSLRGSQAAGLVQPITMETIRNAVAQRKSKADKNKAQWQRSYLQ